MGKRGQKSSLQGGSTVSRKLAVWKKKLIFVMWKIIESMKKSQSTSSNPKSFYWSSQACIRCLQRNIQFLDYFYDNRSVQVSLRVPRLISQGYYLLPTQVPCNSVHQSLDRWNTQYMDKLTEYDKSEGNTIKTG